MSMTQLGLKPFSLSREYATSSSCQSAASTRRRLLGEPAGIRLAQEPRIRCANVCKNSVMHKCSILPLQNRRVIEPAVEYKRKLDNQCRATSDQRRVLLMDRSNKLQKLGCFLETVVMFHHVAPRFWPMRSSSVADAVRHCCIASASSPSSLAGTSQPVCPGWTSSGMPAI